MDDKQLTHLLGTMDIPTRRYDHLNKVNITWLAKNLAARNSQHPKFDIVMKEIQNRFDNRIWGS